jgi:Secretion system C-terminal sorting domain
MAVGIAISMLPDCIKAVLEGETLDISEMPAPIITKKIVDERSSNSKSASSECWIYPNPSTTELFVSIPPHTSGQVTITDLSGRSILTQKVFANEGPIRLANNLHAGIYIARFQGEDGHLLIEKIVVQKN